MEIRFQGLVHWGTQVIKNSRVIIRPRLLMTVRRLHQKRGASITVDIYGHILPTQNCGILNSLNPPTKKLRAVTI